MFDADGKCTEPFALNLTAPNGIESLVLTFSSTNSAFMDALTEIQIPHSLDLCATTQGPAYAILSGFGLPLGDKLRGATSKQFDIAGQIPMLYANPGFEGTHTFACTLTDAKGLSTSAELRLVVSKGTAKPTVAWQGHDLTQRHEIFGGETIDIDITAEAGIQSLVVEIISEKLTPEELLSVGIPAVFDLCNVPAAGSNSPEEVAAILSGFGFPVNEEVAGKTVLPTISITPFVALMQQVASDCNNDFKLTITDKAGQTTIETLQLYVHPLP